jgi:predicted Rossmann-fold nucleotide-binding protein
VLMGSDYWDGLVRWLRDTVLAEGKIHAVDLDLLQVTDDVDEAVKIMIEAREHRGRAVAADEAEMLDPHRPD